MKHDDEARIARMISCRLLTYRASEMAFHRGKMSSFLPPMKFSSIASRAPSAGEFSS